MTFSNPTIKKLWGKAGGKCSFPDCTSVFVEPTAVSAETHTGEMCHIVAEQDNGPRGDTAFPLATRNEYSNLILLCRNHHRTIDTQIEEYTVDKLHQMKEQHELAVYEALHAQDSQHEQEHYSALISQWSEKFNLKVWRNWTGRLMSVQPWITIF